MIKNLLVLFKTEFIRTWTKGKIISLVIFTILSCVISVLPILFNMLGDAEIPNLDFTELLINIWKIIVPFAALFFASGIISNDVKNHWLRTVLSHAVTRQDVVVAKLKSATVSVMIIMLLIGVLPLLVFDISSSVSFNYNISSILEVFVLFTLEASLFISIALWLSCFLGGFMNIFFLALWMFMDNTVFKGILSVWLSANKSGSIMMDFFFPSGFSEAAVVAGSAGSFPTEFILWGFAALTFFIAASLYHINHINIDINTD